VNRMLLPLGAAPLVNLALPLAGTVLKDGRNAQVKVSMSSCGATSSYSDTSSELTAPSRPPELKSAEQTDQKWVTAIPCAAPFLVPQRGEVGGAKCL